jgi:hypothetical protein
MYGMPGDGSYGLGIDGPHLSNNSPRRKTGQHDQVIVLDIPDHAYVDSNFKAEVELMAAKAKLVRCLGTGFYNETGSTQEMVSTDPWTKVHQIGPSAYTGGSVASHWWVTAWVEGESDGWFQPLKVPKYIPTWLQISAVTWFFGKSGRYETDIVWNIRNGIKPNWSALQRYENVAKEMSSNLLSLAPK